VRRRIRSGRRIPSGRLSLKRKVGVLWGEPHELKLLQYNDTSTGNGVVYTVSTGVPSATFMTWSETPFPSGSGGQSLLLHSVYNRSLIPSFPFLYPPGVYPNVWLRPFQALGQEVAVGASGTTNMPHVSTLTKQKAFVQGIRCSVGINPDWEFREQYISGEDPIDVPGEAGYLADAVMLLMWVTYPGKVHTVGDYNSFAQASPMTTASTEANEQFKVEMYTPRIDQIFAKYAHAREGPTQGDKDYGKWPTTGNAANTNYPPAPLDTNPQFREYVQNSPFTHPRDYAVSNLRPMPPIVVHRVKKIVVKPPYIGTQAGGTGLFNTLPSFFNQTRKQYRHIHDAIPRIEGCDATYDFSLKWYKDVMYRARPLQNFTDVINDTHDRYGLSIDDVELIVITNKPRAFWRPRVEATMYWRD
jgi:hypothetical protein